MAESRLDALRISVERLNAIAGTLTEHDLTGPAYPTDWTIADVLSHLGSGAAIFIRRLDDILAGQETPEEFPSAVWDEWDSKSPEAKRTDGLTADTAFLDALEGVSAAQREQFTFSMGPIDVDFDGFVGLRLNEHALHTWDIDVALDPEATIPGDIAALVAGNLGLIARFTAKPTGDTGTITVATPDGVYGLTADLTPDAATVTTGLPAMQADLLLDLESLVRLVYGRLDPEHSPDSTGQPQLAKLRKVFPGP